MSVPKDMMEPGVVIMNYDLYEDELSLMDRYVFKEGSSHGYEEWAERHYNEYHDLLEAYAKEINQPVIYADAISRRT